MNRVALLSALSKARGGLQHNPPPTRATPSPTGQGGWSALEDATLRRLSGERRPLGYMAGFTQRSRAAIRERLAALGLPGAE